MENQSSIRTRKMILADVVQVHVLEMKCFSVPWSMEAFAEEITSNKLAHYMVLEEDGVIRAYGGFWVIVDEAHITNIAVDPNLRQRGLGKALVGAMMHAIADMQIERVTLEVRSSNLPAIRLYEGFGFTRAGVRPNYYQEPKEDAIIMWLDLSEEGHADDRE